MVRDQSGNPLSLGLMIVAGVVATGISLALVTEYGHHFKEDEEIRGKALSMGRPDPADAIAYQEEVIRVIQRNAALNGGLIGLTIAALIGLTAGILQKSIPGLAVGLIAGAVIGGSLSAGAGHLGCVVLSKIEDPDSSQMDLYLIAANCIFWGGVGLSVGLSAWLATAVSKKRPLNFVHSVGSGLMSGVLAAFLYFVVSSLTLIGDATNTFIPDNLSGRAAWIAIPTLICSACIGWNLKKGTATQPSPPQPEESAPAPATD